MKKFLLLAVLIILPLGIYQFWVNTPYYSLLQIQKSIETKDVYLFEKHVDVDRIIGELINDVARIVLRETNSTNNGSTTFNAAALQTGFMELIKPGIKSLIEEGFQDLWDGDIEESEYLDESDINRAKQWIASAEFDYLRQDGKIANVGISFIDPDSQEKSIIELKLNKFENYWKVTEISNFEEQLNKVFKDYADILNS
jgi:hypothetical protein